MKSISNQTKENNISLYKTNTSNNFNKARTDVGAFNSEVVDLNISTRIIKNIPKSMEVANATGTMVINSVRSGIAKFDETLIDGLAQLGSYEIKGLAFLGGKVVGVVDKDLENKMNAKADQLIMENREFVSEDLVGDFNNYYYNETNKGKNINEKSYYKYDSDEMKKVQDVSQKATEVTAATAVTIASGGAAAGVIGGVYSYGNAAENTYQNSLNTSFGDEAKMVSSGVLGAASWIATGRLGAGAVNASSTILKSSGEFGAKATFEGLKTTLKSTINKDAIKQSVKAVFTKDGFKAAVISSMKDPIDVLQTVGIAGDNVSRFINKEEELNVKTGAKAVGEVIGTALLNITFQGISDNLSNNVKLKNITTLDDGIKDDYINSIIKSRVDDPNGVGNNYVFYHGGLEPEFEINELDVLRQSNKQGSQYAGFYMYNELNKNGAIRYAINSNDQFNTLTKGIGKIELSNDLKIYEMESGFGITRLTKDRLQELADMGYDLVVGKPPIGGAEYVLLNKNKIVSYNFETIADAQKVVDTTGSGKLKLSGRPKFDVNKTYTGYHKLFKANEQSLDFQINKLLATDDGTKTLLELPNSKGLTNELIDKLPDNVSIRITGGYTEEYLNTLIKPNGSLSRETATYSKDELKKIMSTIEEIESHINPEWNEYQKSLYLYDYMKKNTLYRLPKEIEGLLAEQGVRSKHYDSLTSLTDKISTCNGYAFTFKELCERQGITCYHVKSKRHAWNILEIDGKPFMVDIINDSIDYEKGIDVTTHFGTFESDADWYKAKCYVDLVRKSELLDPSFVEEQLAIIKKTAINLDYESDAIKQSSKIARTNYLKNTTWESLLTDYEQRLNSCSEEEAKVLIEKISAYKNYINGEQDILDFAKSKDFNSLEDFGKITYDEAKKLKFDLSNVKNYENISDDMEVEIKDISANIRAQVAKVEPVVTNDLIELENTKVSLIDGDTKLKEVDRIKSKIIENMSDNKSLNDSVEKIHDALRYTYVTDNENYVVETKRIMEELSSKGYKLEESGLSNCWDGKNQNYKGINAKYYKMINGEKVKFEVQFHTNESYIAKNGLTHDSYEVRRNMYIPDKIKEIANNIQSTLIKTVESPKNIDSLFN